MLATKDTQTRSVGVCVHDEEKKTELAISIRVICNTHTKLAYICFYSDENMILQNSSFALYTKRQSLFCSAASLRFISPTELPKFPLAED